MLKSYTQWMAAFGAYLLVFQVGIQIGWASPNITRLSAKDSEIPLSSDEASWLVSTINIGGLIGAVLGAFTNEYIGSRKTLLAALTFVSVSWGSLIAANSVEWLFFSRLIGGISCIMTYACFSIYLGEVSRPAIRGTLISVAASGSACGVVIGTIAESYLPMKLSSSIYLIISLLGIMVILYLYDSPYHLIKADKLKKAKKSIVSYDKCADADQELVYIQDYIKSEKTPQTITGKIKEFKTPVVRKALVLVIILFSLPHISGEMAIMAYLETLLINAKSTFINPKEFVIIAHVIGISSSFLTVNLIDKFGRRVMLMISSIGVSISIGILGIYFYLLHSGSDLQQVHWLPFACVAVYRISHAAGYLQIPAAVLGEILPENIKSFAVCIACLFATFFSFLTSIVYQAVVDLAGEECIMWIYAGLSLLTIPFVIFVLPETKGKSFQEIQDLLKT